MNGLTSKNTGTLALVTGLYGILLRSDGNYFSPLVMVTDLSYLGIAIFYPIWCLHLGRWILSKQNESVVATLA